MDVRRRLAKPFRRHGVARLAAVDKGFVLTTATAGS
jgi:hypothetical protein